MSEVKPVYAHSISEYRHFAKSFIGVMQDIVKGNTTQAKAAMDELLLRSGAMTPEEAPGYSLACRS